MVSQGEYLALSKEAWDILDDYVRNHPVGWQFEKYGYRMMLGAFPTSPPPVPLGAPGIQHFIRYLADARGYILKFHDMSDAPIRDMDGFVSWLVVTDVKNAKTLGRKPTLRIVFNKRMAKETVAKSASLVQDHKIGKAFLHEAGHLVKHLPSLLIKAMQGEEFPSVTPKDENEAWILALAWWQLLVGEASQYWREQGEPDRAWIMS